MNMIILAWRSLRNTLVWCVVLRSVQLHLYYTHRRNFGGGGKGAHALPMFFVPKNSVFGYWVEEGQMKDIGKDWEEEVYVH